MPRVSQESIEKLNAFINSLPVDARGKCALCTETLTHIVKMAEVETGAGTATVTRVLAEKINETAAPQDQVSGKALNERVRTREGKDLKISERENKPTTPEPPKEEEKPEMKPAAQPSRPTPAPVIPFSTAKQFSMMAISQLTRIRPEDPQRVAALMEVIDYINDQLKEKGEQQ